MADIYISNKATPATNSFSYEYICLNTDENYKVNF